MITSQFIGKTGHHYSLHTWWSRECNLVQLKSYVSAIKRILVDDGYHWNNDKILLTSLTRACRLVNDRVKTCLPINCGLLEVLLFELERYFADSHQLYLELLYKSIFILGYYDLLRIGELTYSPHTIHAKDVHLADNKEKLLLVLYTSKTHSRGMRPQKIKIVSNKQECSGKYICRNFCPFAIINDYLEARGEYDTDEELFFIFRDQTPVCPNHARNMLKLLLSRIGLDHNYYGMHSLCIGRCSDLVKYGYQILDVKILGCWKSNCVYKYIGN